MAVVPEALAQESLRHLGMDCRDPEATDGNSQTHPCVLDSGNPCRNDDL
ncbi:hypothetical protein [Methylovulum sp.]|nr:hypothetical protein [Methylovulum sp.]